MPAPRRFDWDEARQLRSEGWTYPRLAERYGVSATAVWLACNDEGRARVDARGRAWQRSGTCPDCGAPATRNATRGQYRCRECFRQTLVTTVRPQTLKCKTCERWLPDREFPRSWRKDHDARRNRHRQCRNCNTEWKREWRHRQKQAA